MNNANESNPRATFERAQATNLKNNAARSHHSASCRVAREDGAANEASDLVVVCHLVHLAIRRGVGVRGVIDLHVLVSVLVARHPGERPLAWTAELELAVSRDLRHHAHALAWRRQVVGHEDRVASGIL